MTVEVYLALLLPVLLSAVARRAADRVRPAIAVRGLVAASLTAAAISAWALVMMALTLCDDVPPLSALGRQPALHLPKPVPDPVGLLAAVALVWCGVRAAGDLYRRHDTARRLRAAGTPADGMTVADWATPLAVAVPGRPGHVLVTTGMVRLLDADERRAVLAHERAHLVHRHHLAVAATAVAAAVNPLLGPVRDTVAYLVERWADEDAAVAVADRGLVARAVARAALGTVADRPVPVLGVHGGVIVRRVRALHRPPVGPGRRMLAASAAAVAACVVAGVAATEDFVEVARAWLG